jgi:glutamate racemase
MSFLEMSNLNRPEQPIGIFDSGIGGLTVVRAIKDLLPKEDLFYLGDTARLPYGNKDRLTIERYSLEIAGLLTAEGAKLIVVACNTASALALPRLHEVFRIPIIGVIESGARAAVAQTQNRRVGIIGTRATVASRAYERTIQSIDPGVTVLSQPCPLLVPLIEEGMFDHSVTIEMLHHYLDPLIAERIDTLVLGCTHYPLLKKTIAGVIGDEIVLVDSAENCAAQVVEVLRNGDLENRAERPGNLEVALTDSSNPFFKTADRVLELNISRVQTRIVQGVTMAAAPLVS